jgi:hypothetical protein
LVFDESSIGVLLCEICSPEAVDARAKADQRALRRELKESGRLVEEMWRRAYERNPDRPTPPLGRVVVDSY